jgi:hypothetical protein
MKYFKNLIYLFLILIGCRQVETKSSENKPILNLQFVDSLTVQGVDLRFQQAIQNKLLFYTPSSNSILTHHNLNDTTYTINRFGFGPEEYQILFNNLGFYDDSKIMVGGLKSISIYDKSGNFLESVPANRRDSFAPMMYLKKSGNDIFYIEQPQGNYHDYNFYSNPLPFIGKLNILENSFQTLGSFPFEESHYLKNKEYYMYSGFIFWDLDEDNVFALGKNESIIQVISKDKSKPPYIIKFEPEYFFPYPIPMGRVLAGNEVDEIMFQNSSFQGIIIDGDKIILPYTIPYSNDEIQDFIKNHPDFYGLDKPPLKYALTILQKETGNSMYLDFQIPSDLGKLIYARNDTLYFQIPNKTWEENETIIKRFTIKK